MNRQSGVIAGGYIWLAGGIAAIAALTGLVVAGNKYAASLDAKGYSRGVAETTAAFQKRDNAQLQAVVAAQKVAEVRAAAAEDVASQAQETARSAYSKGIASGKAQTARLIAASTRLRDPGASPGTCPAGSGPIGAPEVAAGPAGDSGHDGGGGLSDQATQFLLSEADRANAVVLKLNDARARILSDLTVCNQP